MVLGRGHRRAIEAATAAGGGTTSTSYCYNAADQLVSSKTGTSTNTQYAYDDHGNQTQDHGTTLTWDAADRLAGATPSGITTLGARAYQASEGRFLSVDPIEGGCANNYVYVNGDPFTVNDLTGQKGCTITLSKSHGNAYWGGVGAGAAATDVTAVAYGGHKLFSNPGARMSARFVGHTTFWATFISDMTYSYITTGKVNPCTSGAYGAVTAIGAWLIALAL